MRFSVCPHDALLHRKRGVFHVLQPATLDEALTATERTEHLEDCEAECWRNVPGGHECRCDDEHKDGTTSAPGGW